jgi:hypothetical protein
MVTFNQSKDSSEESFHEGDEYYSGLRRGEIRFAILAGTAGAQMRSLHGVHHRRVRGAL